MHAGVAPLRQPSAAPLRLFWERSYRRTPPIGVFAAKRVTAPGPGRRADRGPVLSPGDKKRHNEEKNGGEMAAVPKNKKHAIYKQKHKFAFWAPC